VGGTLGFANAFPLVKGPYTAGDVGTKTSLRSFLSLGAGAGAAGSPPRTPG
jgi:hypothetical protein